MNLMNSRDNGWTYRRPVRRRTRVPRRAHYPPRTTLSNWVKRRLESAFTAWLVRNVEAGAPPATDRRRLYECIRAGDVVLISGRTRMSRFVKYLSGSPWTHVALCLGRPEEYTDDDPTVRSLMVAASHHDPKEPLLIEALIDRGTVLSPLNHYRSDALKICRPRGLSKQQIDRVIQVAIRHLGFDYDLRQVLDLARLVLPLPSFLRRWRSTVFEPQGVDLRRCICSTLLVQAFATVAHPIVALAAPHIATAFNTSVAANPRLATPSDFELSPYFERLEFLPS